MITDRNKLEFVTIQWLFLCCLLVWMTDAFTTQAPFQQYKKQFKSLYQPTTESPAANQEATGTFRNLHQAHFYRHTRTSLFKYFHVKLMRFEN